MERKEWEGRSAFEQSINPKPDWEERQKRLEGYEQAWKTPVQKLTDDLKKELGVETCDAKSVMGALSGLPNK